MVDERFDCIIIGAGAAGISAGISYLENSESGDCVVLGSQLTNSSLSPWNIRDCGKDQLRRKIKEGGDNLCEDNLLDKYVDNYHDNLEFMEELGIEFEESNLGIIPVNQERALNKFYEKYENDLDGEIKDLKVQKLLLNEKGNIRGVSADGRRLAADKIIIACGGLTNLFEYTSGFTSDEMSNIIGLAMESGIELDNLEFMMYHPFLVVDEKLPRALISGTILQSAVFLDENGEEFLSKEIRTALRNNRHHNKFGKMTREFYIQSRKSDITADISEVEEEEFERFKKQNEYGWVFRGRSLEQVEKFKINPTFHYSLGGIVTDEKCRTNQKNVYAVGEAATGLHGSNRIGGTAIPEAIIFGRIAGKQAAKNNSKQKNKITEEIGSSNISEELRKEVWQHLGPVKNREKLQNYKEKLGKKQTLSTEEKLIKRICDSVLDREENIGSHYLE